ncbi:bifunctional folylpolyglutamate synthase/dihydrofolate synthase [Anaerosalibacter bizertensis]|uniref:tetrahydrofolate synthase n=1 Tax=Anaerosalibacter bizertensis TaxID=932217 RepID=A0A9Q4ADW2_9FIRM|nr:folylpolyglutamate synthase/dihydrofolate synthase family protein [Anaerosalibacter bizertensis]MBV1819026.1 bifunctional folylpolyglutamate synthase/dihydrofolate synthase [Bacteroidales bacterium MSK.15.36]MCB5560000.1 bifunctional folylpolyglutamate synthase/dihydrofolate synthase [Anaerosalibacter bizertensis]MCG4565743.1 bifunctional folylpolyglutamate synthase/dihydrofolate synthase [Anaerosalibacter bizertensis]MCG4582989.1 bifunctional folylpolyglutamate synthase/dihydrofolate syntha
MNYEEALDFINGAEGLGSKLGLKTIEKLMNELGNPQKNLKYIHIAGTNGKGSTASYISKILEESGYRVGIFTSPYLERFNERIQINGKDIPDETFAKITENVKEKTEKIVSEGFPHPTVFELITAISFLYFKEENVDFVVLEVGLGGRLDSTNVIDGSLLSVITTVDYDHMNVLGDSLDKIAREKAGIIKENGTVLSYPQKDEVFKTLKEVSKDKNADFSVCPIENINVKELNEYGAVFDFKYKDDIFEDMKINLLGLHQVYNASLAISAIAILRNEGLIKTSNEEIKRGLTNTFWKGRLEVLRRKPIFLIDGAHNLQGIKTLVKSLELFKYNRLILGMSILKDKDFSHMVENIAPLADEIIITEINNPRKMEAENLAKEVGKANNNIIIEKDIKKAIEKSLNIANEDDLIVFAGSIYLIGDVRKILLNN